MHVKYVVFCFLFFLIFAGIHLSADDFDDHFRKAQDAVFNQKEDPDDVYSLISESRSTILQIPREQERLYWLARLEYLAGYMELLTREDPEAAERRFRKSESLVEQSLSIGEFSDGYGLLSDIIGRLCQIKGKMYALRKGRNVEKYAERALELDPFNSKALLMLGSAKVHTPKLFGGDPVKGIRIMLDTLRLELIGKDDLFRLYTGLGSAYSKIGQPEQARKNFNNSLRIFPGNLYASRGLENLL